MLSTFACRLRAKITRTTHAVAVFMYLFKMTCNAAKHELSLKHFGFAGYKQVQWYTSQWCTSKIPYMLFRCFMFVYFFGWLIGHVISREEDFFYYLTNWVETLTCAYQLIAFAVALHGLLQEKLGHDKDEKRSCWYHAVTLILFNMSFVMSATVFVIFWAVLAPYLPRSFVSHPLIIQLHAINVVLLIIDIFVSSFEIRLLHFVYSEIFGLTYVTFTVILHAAGLTSAVYFVLDWGSNVGLALGVVAVIGFIAVPVGQLIAFGLYQLRTFLARLYFHQRSPKAYSHSNRTTAQDSIHLDEIALKYHQDNVY